jgi:hypothetical protein
MQGECTSRPDASTQATSEGKLTFAFRVPSPGVKVDEKANAATTQEGSRRSLGSYVLDHMNPGMGTVLDATLFEV